MTRKEPTLSEAMQKRFQATIESRKSTMSAHLLEWTFKTIDKFNEDIFPIPKSKFEYNYPLPVSSLRHAHFSLIENALDYTSLTLNVDRYLPVVKVSDDLQFEIIMDNSRENFGSIYIHDMCFRCNQHIFFHLYNVDSLAWYISMRNQFPPTQADDADDQGNVNPYDTGQQVLDLMHKCTKLDTDSLIFPDGVLLESLNTLINTAITNRIGG